jgi:intracellular septation protein
MTNKSHENFSKFLYDYLPLIVFFTVFKFSKAKDPIIPATMLMLITTIFALIICYCLTRKIPKVAVFSGSMLAIFGGLTIFFNDDIFIKIKPTIINLLFSLILFYGYYKQKPFLSYLIGDQIKISKNAWLILSLRWSGFFLLIAIINEIIWRNFTTDQWVKFKVFGAFTLTMAFTFLQIPYMLKEIKNFKEEN